MEGPKSWSGRPVGSYISVSMMFYVTKAGVRDAVVHNSKILAVQRIRQIFVFEAHFLYLLLCNVSLRYFHQLAFNGFGTGRCVKLWQRHYY